MTHGAERWTLGKRDKTEINSAEMCATRVSLDSVGHRNGQMIAVTRQLLDIIKKSYHYFLTHNVEANADY